MLIWMLFYIYISATQAAKQIKADFCGPVFAFLLAFAVHLCNGWRGLLWMSSEKRLRNPKPWTCMLTHCDKHKQAIYLGTFNRDLHLTQTTDAFSSS